jgi:hypothetical protein
MHCILFFRNIHAVWALIANGTRYHTLRVLIANRMIGGVGSLIPFSFEAVQAGLRLGQAAARPHGSRAHLNTVIELY